MQASGRYYQSLILVDGRDNDDSMLDDRLLRNSKNEAYSLKNTTMK